MILTINDVRETNRAVITLRRQYPSMPIFARAKDADHKRRLQATLDVAAMVPILPEDNIVLTLPFGGAVLESLGMGKGEVEAILEAQRKEVLGLKAEEEEEGEGGEEGDGGGEGGEEGLAGSAKAKKQGKKDEEEGKEPTAGVIDADVVAGAVLEEPAAAVKMDEEGNAYTNVIAEEKP